MIKLALSETLPLLSFLQATIYCSLVKQQYQNERLDFSFSQNNTYIVQLEYACVSVFGGGVVK